MPPSLGRVMRRPRKFARSAASVPMRSGMSTVPEVIAARQLGRRVLALATITNRAAGLSRAPLTHEEVLSVGKAAAWNLKRLLDVILPKARR